MPTDRKKARRVLGSVLQKIDVGLEPPTAVLGAWIEDEETICIVRARAHAVGPARGSPCQVDGCCGGGCQVEATTVLPSGAVQRKLPSERRR